MKKNIKYLLFIVLALIQLRVTYGQPSEAHHFQFAHLEFQRLDHPDQLVAKLEEIAQACHSEENLYLQTVNCCRNFPKLTITFAEKTRNGSYVYYTCHTNNLNGWSKTFVNLKAGKGSDNTVIYYFDDIAKQLRGKYLALDTFKVSFDPKDFELEKGKFIFHADSVGKKTIPYELTGRSWLIARTGETHLFLMHDQKPVTDFYLRFAPEDEKSSILDIAKSYLKLEAGSAQPGFADLINFLQSYQLAATGEWIPADELMEWKSLQALIYKR